MRAERIDPISGVKVSEYEEGDSPEAEGNPGGAIARFVGAARRDPRHHLSNLGAMFRSHLGAIKRDPTRFAKRYVAIAIASLVLWKYLTLFLGMAVETSQEVSLNIVIAGKPSATHYPVADQVMIVGGICLASFLLIQNEISLRTLRNPLDYRSYIASLSGVLGFLLFWLIAENMEMSPRTQAPFLIVGGTFLTGFLLIQDEMKDLSLLVVESIKNPRGAIGIWKGSWRGVIVSISAISAFLFTLVNLSLVGSFVPLVSREMGTFFSLMMVITIVAWLLIMSKESVKPSIVYKRHSSMAFLLASPFLLYVAFRIMLLMRTDTTWDVSWDFMDDIAGFSITSWPEQVDINRGDRWEFHWAGVINAVRVVLISIVLCTVVGIVVGMMRLSSHRLSSLFGTVYVEVFRNMPLALLLFTISITLGNSIPELVEEVMIADMILLSNQGVILPSVDSSLFLTAIAILAIVKVFTIYLDRDGFDDSDKGLKKRFAIWVGAIGASTGIALSGGLSVPTIWKRIETSPGSWVVEGGFEVSLPFLCIIAGLTIYTSAIVAEIVRGSIQSLPRGQIEAGISLGLTPFQRLRLVIMPQALRSMVPALNNQYMNVWKNSSLAMIVSYNDVFYVNLVIVNKIGKAVPTFLLILVTYQIGSLVISAIMNVYNRRVTRVQI